MTNLGKEADIWLNLRPGTDGAMAIGLARTCSSTTTCTTTCSQRSGPTRRSWLCNDVEPSGYEVYRFTSGKCQIKTRLLKESDLKEDGDPHNVHGVGST